MSKFDKDSLGARMKGYEESYEYKLVPRLPMIIRIDGKAFHTFTKGFKRPFDSIFRNTMQQTMQSLCKDISTCKFGYTQSDEITLVLYIDDVIKTEGYFDYKYAKILTITASKATKYFNKYFIENAESAFKNKEITETEFKKYKSKFHEAEFDSRVFNIPEYDIINNIIWRQQDCVRNSIASVGQSYFSSKELNKVNCNGIMDKLILEKDINWNDFKTHEKRGSCCYKKTIDGKKFWIIDNEMPILTQDKEFFNNIVFNKKED